MRDRGSDCLAPQNSSPARGNRSAESQGRRSPDLRPAILVSVQGDSAGGRVGSEQGGIVRRTARLSLLPLTGLDEAEHARASRNAEDALRDTHAAEPQWRDHGFGPWAIRDNRDDS